METYPNLKSAKMIGVDTETRDPDLLDKGPGAARGDKNAYVLGYSIAADGYMGYFPIRHTEGNLDPENTRRWLRDTLGDERPKCFANALYDLEFAKADGVEIRGPAYDCQVFEFLLDEERKTYKLDALAEAYFAEGKNEDGLAEAVRQALGKKVGYLPDDSEVKSNLWRLPAKYVADYAAQDASLALRIVEQQIPELHKEELWDVAMLETKLLDCLLEMRFRGVPVNLERAQYVREEITKKAAAASKTLFSLAGSEINPRSAGDVAKAAERLGLTFPQTEKGNPSFAAGWVRSQNHPFWVALSEVKQFENAADLHVQKKIIDLAHGGKVFPSFHAVRKEKEGTETMAGTRKGRFASSNPNAAQIPSRHPYLGPLIRSCFVPEKNQQWLSADWSQQEPRLTVHYASLLELPGAQVFRDRYRENPDTDMHSLTAEIAGIDRKLAKTINLGLSYGMGAAKLSASLNLPEKDARDLMKRYNDALPFIRSLGDRCSALATSRGYIKTIMGRRSRFNFYGPSKWTPGIRPLRKAEAVAEWGNAIRPWNIHKALNNLVQGSGADMIKLAMVQCHSAGFTPLNTIYDELDFSIESEKDACQIKEIMLTGVKLEVPLKVDLDLGPSWGEAKELKL